VKKKARKRKHSSNRQISISQDSLKNILRQSLLILFISVIGEGFTGFILTGMKTRLSALPGLLVLVPALTDLRGNIGAAFGERLSTMLHLGIVKPIIKITRIAKHNIFASLTLTISMAFLIGATTPYISKMFNMKSIGALRLSIISTSAGILSAIVLLPIVFVLVFFAFKHHVDPDNIIAPMLPVIGDIITVSAIFGSTILTTKLLPVSSISFVFLAILPFLNGFARKRKRRNNKFPKRYRYPTIIKQSSPVLIICLSIGITSGIFLQSAGRIFSIYPALLSLIPQVIAQGGSIGGIVGSRVSTALYLGNAKPFQPGKEARKNFIAGIVMGLVVAPFVAIISLGSSLITKAATPPLIQMLTVAFLSLFILSILMSVIAILLAFFSFKIGIDPSNVVIPIITSIGDITGVIVLLVMIKIFIL